jgi:predicted N-acetyltransferase YhbS
MGRLFEVGHRLWQRAEWGAPPFLERTLFPRLYELEELVLPLIKPHLDVYELQGQGNGSPLKVTYVGLDYGKPYLESIMFADEPEEVAREPVSFWHPDEVANAPDSDIVIAAGSERLIRKLPRQNAIILPLYVEHVLDIQGDWEDVKKRLRQSKGVRNEFRAVERYGYTYEVSHDGRDFEMHYHTMYLPTMEKRHGDAAIIVSEEEARQHFRHGCLLLVKRDGQVVAGGLCRPRGDRLRFIYLGIASADEQLMKERIIGALYVSRIHWANQAGYKAVDLLGCPPYLRMGVFQYKRKWGTTIGIPPTSHKQIWFRFQRDTPAVRQFLKDNPCVIIDEHGDLQALIVVDDPGDVTPEVEAQWQKQYFTPGMKGMLVRSVSDVLKEPDDGPDWVKDNPGSGAIGRRVESDDSPISARL